MQDCEAAASTRSLSEHDRTWRHFRLLDGDREQVVQLPLSCRLCLLLLLLQLTTNTVQGGSADGRSMVRRNAAVNGVLRTALLRLRCDVHQSMQVYEPAAAVQCRKRGRISQQTFNWNTNVCLLTVLYDMFFSEVFLTLRSFSLAPPVPSRSSLTPRRAAAALAPCSIVWT